MPAKESTSPRIVFPSAGQVIIEENELHSLNKDEIRIETHRTLISTGTEMAHLIGKEWKVPGGVKPNYPTFPGYSNAGVVVEVGEGVESFQAGDRVASTANHAQYVTLRERGNVWKIPDGVSFEEATFCTLACTVLNGVRMGIPQLGDAAAVVGLGLLGQMACQFLKRFGAQPIIGIDLDDFRLELASQVGAVSHTRNSEENDAASFVRDLTEGRGADIVYEVTGLTETYNLTFELARRHGRVVALGSPRWPAMVDMMQVHMKALKVIGAIVSSHPVEENKDNRWTRRANGELFMELLTEGVVNVKDLITHRFAYTDAAKAYQMLEEKKENFLGVILEW